MPTMPEATAALDIRSLNTKFNEMVKFIQSAAGDELAIHKVEEILWRQMLRMGMRPCPCLSPSPARVTKARPSPWRADEAEAARRVAWPPLSVGIWRAPTDALCLRNRRETEGRTGSPRQSIAVTPGEILLAVAEAESDGPPGDAVSASQGYGNFSKTGVRLLNPFAE